MDKLKYLIIFFLGICILIASNSLTDAISSNNFPTSITVNEPDVHNGLYTISKALKEMNNGNDKEVLLMTDMAAFLNIRFINLKRMIEEQDSTIPYIKVDDVYVFSKSAVLKWMEGNQEVYMTQE